MWLVGHSNVIKRKIYVFGVKINRTNSKSILRSSNVNFGSFIGWGRDFSITVYVLKTKVMFPRLTTKWLNIQMQWTVFILTINSICLEVTMNENKLCFFKLINKNCIRVSIQNYFSSEEKWNEWKKYSFCGQSKSQKMEIEKLNLKRSFVWYCSMRTFYLCRWKRRKMVAVVFELCTAINVTKSAVAKSCFILTSRRTDLIRSTSLFH